MKDDDGEVGCEGSGEVVEEGDDEGDVEGGH